ncbi:MAG: phosphoribosylformylglycinamidine cyclo-ligase [Thermoplasmata archaeon]|nr:phosphoribosylformylglycinamidine cyclo-ligase [Thermoplasmata archaeon]
MGRFTYSGAGVDIDREEKVVKTLIETMKARKDRIAIGDLELVLCTDGVGSKVIVANEMKKWDTIGIDCMAMNVNDALVMGARPLAFVDYLAMERMDERMAEEIAKGLKAGAEKAGVEIIGGETATLPEIIKGFDLAGTCVGVVERNIPAGIKEGDVIIGMRSSGIHSNGYTLARKVFTENGYDFHDEMEGIGIIGYALLEPTRIYVREIIELWENVEVKGIAHVTGGGLRKIKRMAPHVHFVIENPMEPQPVFRIIQKLGNVSVEEMYQTFNMGMGMAVVVDKKDVDTSLDILNRYVEAEVVGKIERGEGVSIPSLGIKI